MLHDIVYISAVCNHSFYKFKCFRSCAYMYYFCSYPKKCFCPSSSAFNIPEHLRFIDNGNIKFFFSIQYLYR